MKFTFTSELWEWSSRANWFFVSVPADRAAEVEQLPMPPRGFGSIPVRVTIGRSSFETSMFPANDSGAGEAREKTYALPVKAAVRKAEGIEKGDLVEVELEVVG